jgi:hypothetical protein
MSATASAAVGCTFDLPQIAVIHESAFPTSGIAIPPVHTL